MKDNIMGHFDQPVFQLISAKIVRAGVKLQQIPKSKIACDEENIARLNSLGKTRPFCYWHKSRDNDPL